MPPKQFTYKCRHIIMFHALAAMLALMLGACNAMNSASNSTPAGSPSEKTHAARPIVLGYYPSWECGLPPEKINYSLFTHLCHSFIGANTSGTLQMQGNMPSRELTSLAHRHSVKVLFSLGGMDSGEVFSAITRNPAIEDRYIKSIVDLMVEYSYDGVDIDWEFPKDAGDQEGFLRLAERFRAEMKRRGREPLVTSAVSGVEWAARWTSPSRACEAFDILCIMTYDQHGPWSDHAGYNSSLHPTSADRAECAARTVEGQMAFWSGKNHAPKTKLIAGFPCYGRGFAVEQWAAPTPRGDKAPHAYIAYSEILKLLNGGWKRQWDAEARVPHLAKEGVRERIAYDDEESIREKAAWTAKNGYAGVFFWEISQDYAEGRNLLVEAAFKELSRK